MKRSIFTVGACIIFLLASTIVKDVNQSNQKVHLKRIELQSTEQKLKQLEDDYQKLHNENSGNQQLRQQLEQQIQELNRQLQARALLKKNTVYAATPPTTMPTGSCAEWMTQAGIPVTEATTKLILNESGCRPDAVNPSSGACGIPQALPCSKMGCSLSDPVCQLRWMNTYVQNRYGTWENALAMWYSRSPHWY